MRSQYMKISELIEKLAKQIKENGDMQVYIDGEMSPRLIIWRLHNPVDGSSYLRLVPKSSIDVT